MKRATLFGLAVCLAACGCIDSKSPLSDAKTAKPDERLIGVWRESAKDAETYYHVGLAGDKYPAGMLRVISITYRGKTLDAADEYVGFTTTLDGKSYLNLVIDPAKIKTFDKSGWKADAVDGYFLVRYAVDGDKATVWSVNPAAKEEAIKSGKIKGIVKGKGESHFTDTTENVAKFVAAAGDHFWNVDEPGHMERLEVAKK